MADLPDLSALDDLDLLRLPYLAIAEARQRGLVTTWDLPVGGYAEGLASLVYGGQAMGAGGVGHDLITPGGRVEVKAVVQGTNTSPAHPQHFDRLVLVRFDSATMSVAWAVELTTAAVTRLGRPHPRGGLTLRAPKKAPSGEGILNVTDLFLAASTLSCPDCGHTFEHPPHREGHAWVGETIQDRLRAHQRIWHDDAGIVVVDR